jgi:hypothetical protein
VSCLLRLTAALAKAEAKARQFSLIDEGL